MDTPAAWCVPPAADPDARARIIWQRVYEAVNDPAVRRAAQACLGCRPKTLSSYGRAAAVLRHAQGVGYVPDPPGCDRYAPVAYTLAHGGDCDDLVPTVMALAILCGLEPMLVYLPQPKAPQDHVTAKIRVDGAWLWAEPSLPGASLGEHPYAATRRLGSAGRVTGALGAVFDGVVANLLTLGLIAAGAYLAGRAFKAGARANPDDESDETARREWKEATASRARHNPAVRANPGSLPLPNEFESREAAVDAYGDEIRDAIADLDAAVARYSRERLADPSDARGSLAQARALQTAARAWSRASTANRLRDIAREGVPGYSFDAKVVRDAREQRAKIVDAYIGAAVQSASSPEVRASRSLLGRGRDPELPYERAKDLMRDLAVAQSKVGGYSSGEVRGLLSDLGDGVGDLIEMSGLPTAARAFDTQQGSNPPNLAHERARLCEEFPKAKACREQPRANPFAGFKNFAACERAARKRDVTDTGAYCGAIKHRVEGYRRARAEREARAARRAHARRLVPRVA